MLKLVLGIMVILGTIACGGGTVDPGDNETASREKSESSPQSSVAATTTALPHQGERVTLTDIDNIFSISVPTHQETTIDLEQLAVEYQSAFEQGAMVMFIGGAPQTGSNVTVIADMQALFTEEPQPVDRDAYVELQLEDLKQQPNFSGEIIQNEVTIDGIYGTQLRYVMGGEVNQIANILLGKEPMMLCGSMVMLITGTAPDEELTIVEQILDSFHVFPTAAVTDTCDDRKALSALELFDGEAPALAAESAPFATAAEERADTATSVPTPALVRAEDIADEFEDNSLAATSKYTGKLITVTDEIEQLDYTFHAWGDYNEEFPYVGIDDYRFRCIIAEEAVSLTAGSEVTVSAEFLYYEVYVYLKPCSVVSTE